LTTRSLAWGGGQVQRSELRGHTGAGDVKDSGGGDSSPNMTLGNCPADS